MNCECGNAMQWRCTNKVTGMAKYKCQRCGNVIEVVDDYEPPIVEKFKPKYYFFKDGRFIVRKKINGKFRYIGSYLDEETADKVVSKMQEYDWNTNMLPRVYEELHMHRENRLWVCV